MDRFLKAAVDQAKQGLAEGGIPIGSVLVMDGRIVGRGHNRCIPNGSAIRREHAGRLESRRPNACARPPATRREGGARAGAARGICADPVPAGHLGAVG